MDDMFLFDPPQDNINQDLAQINQIEDNSNNGEKFSALFILIIAILLIGMDALSLYYSYQLSVLIHTLFF